MHYYEENPDELLRKVELKIERARISRKKRNMKERQGGEMAGTLS